MRCYGKPARRGANAGNGLDVVVNFTGGDTWVKSMRCLKVGGRLLTCGATAGYDPKEDIRFIWTFELEIRGSNGWQRSDIEALLEMVRQGRLNTLVERTYPLGAGRGGAAGDRGPKRIRQDRGGAMSEALNAAELQERLAASPFIRFLSLMVTEADPARQSVTMTLPMRPEFERIAGSGQWHGGPIAAVIDTVGDYALVMSDRPAAADDQFPRGLSAARDEHEADGNGAVRRSGRSVGVVDVDVADAAGNIVAIGRATYATQTG